MGLLKKTKTRIAAAPEEDEAEEEIEQVEAENKTESKKTESQEPQYKEYPVCLSQTQINNIIIENNLLLKQIVSDMQEK